MTVIANPIEQTHQEYPLWLDNFINIYSQLSVDNLNLLDSIYHQDVMFIDPMHRLPRA